MPTAAIDAPRTLSSDVNSVTSVPFAVLNAVFALAKETDTDEMDATRVLFSVDNKDEMLLS